MNLIPIKSAQPGDLPIAKGTAYKWHSECRYPELVFKVTGILVFDMDQWEIMCKEAREANVRNAKRIHKSLRE